MSDLEDQRFPGYDVMAKRDTPSFNEATRAVLDRRLAITDAQPKFFSASEFEALKAIVDRIVPQPAGRAAVPVAGLVDHRLEQDRGDGYRLANMPRQREAWRLGIAALEAEAHAAYGRAFAALDQSTQDLLLQQMKDGELAGKAWGTMPPKQFFRDRLSHDIVMAYYSHPLAWNGMGFGGPASPRGYVRMGLDDKDPWEAAEVRDGDAARARKENARVGR